MKHPSREIMERAIRLATGKYERSHDVAAVIVKGDKIIAEAVTTIDKDNDPTCHAEINAIKIASKKLKSKRLEGCYLYTTYEPCPMCASAIVWARIKGVVYGASMEDETKRCPQRVKIPCKEVLERGTPKVELYPEFMREECKKLLF